MSDLKAVHRVTNGAVAANTYLVPLSTPGECVLIDPGLDRAAIESALAVARLVPIAIFLTHGHFDHLGSAEHFRRTYATELYLHPADKRVAKTSNFLMMAFGMRERIEVPTVLQPMDRGFAWSRGEDHVTTTHVPGHTPGSTILDVNGRLFTGDTIYRDEVWLMDLPEQDQALLADSVRGVWDLFPDGAQVYPGHGGSAAFADIKRSNLPLRALLGIDGVGTA